MNKKTLLWTVALAIVAAGVWLGGHQLWKAVLRLHGH
jgi:hypothetical protein